MSSMSELIERVEKASGGDRELDVAIYRAEFPFPCVKLSAEAQKKFDQEKAPSYTASIDAALTLLPDGCAVERLSLWNRHPASCVVLGTHLHKGEYWHQGKNGRWGAECATPALALAAACLKARIARATGEA